MGLGNNYSGSGYKYLSIIGGKVTSRAEEGEEGAVKRWSDKLQKDVWEHQHGYVEGRITGLEIKELDFGEQLNIKIIDGNDSFILSIPVETKYFNHFVYTMKNIDYSLPVRIAPYSFTPKGEDKVRSGLNILQEPITSDKWEKVTWYYTKENPNGMPVTGENLSKDEFKLAMMQVRIFLKKEVKGFLVPFSNSGSGSTGNKPESHNGDDPSNFNPEETDDLPF